MKSAHAARFEGFADELQKLSEGHPDAPKKPKKRKPQHPMMTVAKTTAGMGTGMLAGFGIGKALEAIAKSQGIPMQKLVPKVLTGAGLIAGAAIPLLHGYERRHMEDYARSRS